MRLDRFGTLALSQIDAEDTLDTPAIVSGLVQTIGSALDSYGDEDALPGTTTISRTFAIHGDTPADMDDGVDAVRGWLGKRAKLWLRTGSNEVRWAWARLTRVAQVRNRRNWNFQPLRCDFELVDGRWHGHDHTAWTLDDGHYLDDGFYLDDEGYSETMPSSPHTITVNNGGNRRVDNVIITILAGSSAITSVTIAKTGETDMDYTGIISSGQALEIDCGAYTVKDNGVSDYANFALASGHTIAEWLRLDPGDNEITITFSGGSNNSTVTIEYRDGWI